MSIWWRAYAEAVDDPKLQRLSADLFRCWFNLLCLAARNDGKLPRLGDVAFRLRMTESRAKRMIDELIRCELLDEIDGRLWPHNWNARQYKSDTSNDRVKRHREAKRNAACNVTPAVTVTPPETDTETDTEKSAAALSARDPVDLIFEAIGVADDPHWYGHKPRVARWLDGWDLELDVLPTVRRLMAGRGPPRSPRFFEAAIAEAHAARLAPLPIATQPRKAHDSENSLVAAGRRRIAELDAIIAAASADGGDAGENGIRSGDANVRLLPPRGRGVG